MRMTGKRIEILETLEVEKKIFTAKQLHALLPHIDLVTIYRNLELFADEGLIKRVHLQSDEKRYEFQKHPHHHAVCGDCDKVVHFEIKHDQLQKFLHLSNFDITDVEIVVRGRCTKKAARNSRRAAK